MNKPEPEIDWSKIPPGTFVEVRDGDNEEWIRCPFLVFTPDEEYRYWVVKSPTYASAWYQCRLAPDVEVKKKWLK